MKEKVIIIGNNDFQREYFDGAYKISSNKYLKGLYDKYEIDNLSKDNISISLIKHFLSKYKYSKCIIDECIGKRSLDSEIILQNIINVVLSFGVLPTVVNKEGSIIDVSCELNRKPKLIFN